MDVTDVKSLILSIRESRCKRLPTHMNPLQKCRESAEITSFRLLKYRTNQEEETVCGPYLFASLLAILFLLVDLSIAEICFGKFNNCE